MDMQATMTKKEERVIELNWIIKEKTFHYLSLSKEELYEMAREMLIFQEFTQFLDYAITVEGLEIPDGTLTTKNVGKLVEDLMESLAHPCEDDFYAAMTEIFK